MYNVLIVEDIGILLDSLAIQLDNTNKYNVTKRLTDASLVLDAIEGDNIDLVLMDVCTENNSDGIVFCKAIKDKYPNIKVVIMTSLPEIDFVTRAKEANADSFVYKNLSIIDLIKVLDDTMNGISSFPLPGTDDKGVLANLTDREKEIVRLFCSGYDRKGVASKLFLSENTIKTYIASILEKTGFETMYKLAVHIVSKGLIVSN